MVLERPIKGCDRDVSGPFLCRRFDRYPVKLFPIPRKFLRRRLFVLKHFENPFFIISSPFELPIHMQLLFEEAVILLWKATPQH
jgi:hypothetical protein